MKDEIQEKNRYMKQIKNIIKSIVLSVLSLLLMASCLGKADGTSFNGFSQVDKEVVYANQEKSYVAFVAYGDAWQIVSASGDNWCTFDKTSGLGGYMYAIWTTCEPNTTGKQRVASYKLQSTSDQGVFVNFNIYQYACRHDGSYGSARLVKSITGDDGSSIELLYDRLCRPSAVSISKDGQLLRKLDFAYSDVDSTLTVISNTSTYPLQASYIGGFQLNNRLASTTDTLAFQIQYDSYAYSAFTVMEKRANGEYNAQAMRFINQKFGPDDDHCADSLRYQRKYPDGTVTTKKLQLEYSEVDNRYQSVDVNQLLFGVEECNPYHLVATYRYTRNSKVYKSAKSLQGEYLMEADRNSDNSVRTLTVTDPTGKKITYTFEYAS